MPITNAHPAQEVLRRNGISQAGLAAALGYHASYVCEVLTSRCPAPVPFRRAVAEYLGMPESALFHDEVESWKAHVRRVLSTAPAAARERANQLGDLLSRDAA